MHSSKLEFQSLSPAKSSHPAPLSPPPCPLKKQRRIVPASAAKVAAYMFCPLPLNLFSHATSGSFYLVEALTVKQPRLSGMTLSSTATVCQVWLREFLAILPDGRRCEDLIRGLGRKKRRDLFTRTVIFLRYRLSNSGSTSAQRISPALSRH